MPCYYTGSAEGDARLEASEARKSLTEVTRILCSTLTFLEDSYPREFSVLTEFHPEVGKWWEKHKKIDNG